MTRRGAAILKLCRESDLPRSERTFMIVECGLHSGFPRCCITFFVKTYEPLAMNVIAMRAHGETIAQLIARAKALRELERYRKQLDRGNERSLGYVACPQCLHEENFVSVRRCDWHLTVRERRRILVGSARRQT